MRDGREVLSPPTPADPADGRAWGGMLAELFAASIDASPVLQQTERSALIRGRHDRHHQAARPATAATPTPTRPSDNRFQRDGGGGIGITVERTDDKKILIRAVQDGSPSAKAGVQVGDQILAIDGELMIEQHAGRRRAQAARQRRRAGHAHRAARLAGRRAGDRACSAAASSRPP